MGALSVSHWLIVLLVVVLVFGPRRLSSLGRELGEGIRALRRGLAGEDRHRSPKNEPRDAPGDDS